MLRGRRDRSGNSLMALRAGAIRVVGLSEVIAAAGHAERSTKKVVREKFREAGEIVQKDATSRFERYDSRTAENFRTYVRIRGVSVEQRLRKTTGLRPDFGKLQMRKGLIPALDAKAGQVERKIEQGLEELTTILNRS